MDREDRQEHQLHHLLKLMEKLMAQVDDDFAALQAQIAIVLDKLSGLPKLVADAIAAQAAGDATALATLDAAIKKQTADIAAALAPPAPPLAA